MRVFPVLFLAFTLLAGCSSGFVAFPVTPEEQKALPTDVEVIPLTTQNVANFASPSLSHSVSNMSGDSDWNYLVGVGDFLEVVVFDHPELLAFGGVDEKTGGSFRVQSDGNFYFPFIGSVSAKGRAPETIRQDITDRLATYIPDPQVDVRVAAFNSQSVLVSGEVNKPAKVPLTTTKMTLVEAITLAGGAAQTADLRRVSVQRGSKRYIVDISGFFEAGIVTNNPVLRSGDVVNIPFRAAEEAYLLGQITKPSVIDLSKESVSVTQAIARQGGLDEQRADARGIFIFRQRGVGKTTVFQLDTKSPTGILIGTRFLLEPRDVVYIVRSPLSKWNDVISGLLPSVQAAQAANDL